MLNYTTWNPGQYFGWKWSVENKNGNIVITDHSRPVLKVVVDNSKKEKQR